MVVWPDAVRRALGVTAGAAALILATACTGDDGDDPGADAGNTMSAPPTGSSATDTSPSEESSPDVATPPREDACYLLDLDDLATAQNDSKPVRCGRPHTAQTFHVGTLAATGSAAAVAEQARETCGKRLRRHVDASAQRLALSRVQATWYVPSDAERADGATWLRCDVVAMRTSDALAKLPKRSAGMLADDADLDDWGSCARVAQDQLAAGRGQRLCALPHSWRAIDAQRLGTADEPYPGRAEVGGDVLDRCESTARAWTDNSTDDIDVGWLPPTRADWVGGQRFGLCWTRTSQ